VSLAVNSYFQTLRICSFYRYNFHEQFALRAAIEQAQLKHALLELLDSVD